MTSGATVPEYRQKYVYMDYLELLKTAETPEKRNQIILDACVDDCVTAQMFISLCVFAYAP